MSGREKRRRHARLSGGRRAPEGGGRHWVQRRSPIHLTEFLHHPSALLIYNLL